MGLNFAPVRAGGNFFRPEDHKDAAACLIEVLDFKRQVPSKFGPKDAVFCDITVFETDADIKSGTVKSEFKNAQIQSVVLVKNLQDLVGQATIAKLTQLPPLNGNRPAWAWAEVSEDVKNGVIEYATKREAEVDAAAADAPDFD